MAAKPVSQLLADLDERQHLDLVNALGAGLHDARLATECVTAPHPQAENVLQLLAYLTQAIDHLRTARDIVRFRID